MGIIFKFFITIIFSQILINTISSNLFDETKEHCQDLQCMKKIFIDNKHQLVHDDGTTDTCTSCEKCYDNGFSVCMQKKSTTTRGGRIDDEKLCSCFNSVPEECRIQPQGPTGYNGAFKAIYNICYSSSIKNPPQPLGLNTKKSVIVTIPPFWTEPYWKDFQLSNLTLIYEYPVESPDQCEREITTNLNGDPKYSCTGTVDINMKSEDISDNADYNPTDLFSEAAEPNYEDLSNELPPEVEFDREVFAGAHNVKLWMSVTARRSRQLILNANSSNIFKNVNTVLSSDVFNFDLQPEIYGTEGRVDSEEEDDEEGEKSNESEGSLIGSEKITSTTDKTNEKVDNNVPKTDEISKEIDVKDIESGEEKEESKEKDISEDSKAGNNDTLEDTESLNDNLDPIDGEDDENNDDISSEVTSLPETEKSREENDEESSEDDSTLPLIIEDKDIINSIENKTIDDDIINYTNNTINDDTSQVTKMLNNVLSYLSFGEDLELSRIVFAGCVVLCLLMLCCTCLCRSKILCCKNRNGDYDKVNSSEFSRNNTQEMLNGKDEEISKLLIESSAKVNRKDYHENSLKAENSKMTDNVTKNNTLRLKQMYQKQYKELISSAPTLDYKRLRLDDIIGDGNFGVVLRQAVLQDMEDVGKIKEVITCSSHKFEKFHNHELDSFLNALAVSVRAKTHPNIVSLIAVDEQFENLLLIFENFNHPDLLTILRDSRKQKNPNSQYASALTPIELLRIMVDCARGTGHLIKSKILHSMLAACNVIVLPNKTIKIGGFGFAEQRQLHCNQYEPKPGPERWQSPEILIPKIYKDTNSKIAQSMIWSLGVLLWETASLGGTPFEMYATNEEFIEAIFLQKAMLTMPAHCSVELLSIFHTCVQYDLVLRPETTDAIVRKLEVLQSDSDSHINLTTTNPGEMFYFPPINTRLEQITARF
uniref:Protein kinase domain-containing protein n=1 Tax=Strongyloides papillosus TaxID=174720 RepID=A0A0N5C5S2_STREA